MAATFLTGATGFLGRSVVKRLPSVVCMRGNLSDPRSYADDLRVCDTVLHLAAVTGKRAPQDYFRTNRDGTGRLLAEAEKAEVRRFIYISSIAAKFNDSSYVYGQSKLEAEALIKRSRLRWTIVRPTMILGCGSAVLGGLSKLALHPVMPVFGNGKARVQPVFVDDLADALISILDDNSLDSRILEIGGPEVVTIESLMQFIRRSKLGRNGRPMHLPLAPIAACLRMLEPVLRPVLPFTAGQLASFRHDGVAEPDPWMEQRYPTMKTIKEMLDAAA
jgi:nucleoside-diphosphate-sugar epimerase